MTCLLVLLFIPTKYYQIISNSIGVKACTRFWFQRRWLHNEESESCLSCTWHAYWSSSSLPNIIKLSQTVWELWPAQDFSFGGDNYITKKMRVVSLTHNLPTVLLFIPTKYYQIVSNSMEVMACTRFQLQGRWLHNKDRVVSLAHNMPTGSPLYFYKYYQNINLRVSKLWSS